MIIEISCGDRLRRARGDIHRWWPPARGGVRGTPEMVADPRIRASDDDRDRTASLLREHHAAGRLTPEEFNERLESACREMQIDLLRMNTRDDPAPTLATYLARRMRRQ